MTSQDANAIALMMPFRNLLLRRCLTPLFVVILSQAAWAQSDQGPTDPLAWRSHLFIACGLPGDADHRTRYVRNIDVLIESLDQHWQFDRENIHVLFGSEEMKDDGNPVPEFAFSPCTRDSLADGLQSLKQEVLPDDRVWIIFMGHGFFDGERATFNVAGWDPTREELAASLDGLSCRESVIWMTTSYSGHFLKALAEPGRVVICATEPGREIISTYFPDALADAVSEPRDPSQLDVDRDGRLTLLDLYVDICRRVGEHYVASDYLIVEHARLDDRGDGIGKEVQVSYLPQKYDGDFIEGRTPPLLTGDVVGAIAASIPLTLSPPAQDPEANTGAVPAP